MYVLIKLNFQNKLKSLVFECYFAKFEYKIRCKYSII